MPQDERTSAAPERPTLAVVMPALDEEAVVGDQVCALRALPAFQALPVAHLRIIVVDNGSRDRTAEVARAAGAEVVREPRRGYGWACLAGVLAAEGAEVVLLMDADGSDDFDGAARVARLVLADEADLAMGARTLDRREHSALTPQQRAGNAVGALALRLLYGARVSDIAPVRAIRRAALLALDPREMAYGWSTEMLAKAARAGLRIVELPVAAHPRAGGKSKVAGTLRGTIGASAHILRTLYRYRGWQPAGETAPLGPSATKSAVADWEQSSKRDDPTRDTPTSAGRRALFVVARLPLAGQTKTRLGRVIGHDAAVMLYRAFLRDLSARLSVAAAEAAEGYDLYWYYTAPADADEAEFAAHVMGGNGYASASAVPPSASASSASSAVALSPSVSSVMNSSAHPSPGGVVGVGLALPLRRSTREDPRRVRFLRQPEGDFAARLWHGFEALTARGYERVVVLGSDSPHVPTKYVAAAFAALETHDIAIGPARDGGYYLLGQRGCPADLFTGIQMSTSRVTAETIARAAALDLSVATLPETFDVDEPADLDTLARALADAPSAEADTAPATRATLAAIASKMKEPATTALAGPLALARSAEGTANNGIA